MPSHDPPCRYSPWCDSFQSTALERFFGLGQQLWKRLVSSVHFAFEVSAGGLAATTPTTRARANAEEAGRGRGPPDAPHRGHNHPEQLAAGRFLNYAQLGGFVTQKIMAPIAPCDTHVPTSTQGHGPGGYIRVFGPHWHGVGHGSRMVLRKSRHCQVWPQFSLYMEHTALSYRHGSASPHL